MDPPKCPVCLEPYNHTSTIPRVLPCGHSVCQSCLTHLHLSSLSPPHTLHCPSCTQLIKFPGPTSLPKNIDLLHFSPQNPTPPKPRLPVPTQLPSFHPLYDSWKELILPHDSVSLDRGSFGKIKISSLEINPIIQCCLVEDQVVGLFELGRFEARVDSVFEHSYVSKVLSVLNSLSNGQRSELREIFGVSSRNCSRVCRVFGLWLNVETGCVYLVSERLGNGDGLVNLGEIGEDWRDFLGSVGVEIFEILIVLRKEGFVCGALGLSCFRLDEFGRVYVDLSEVLVKGRKIREFGQKSDMEGSGGENLVANLTKLDVFVSPDVLLELMCIVGVDKEKNDESYSVYDSSDVWLLAGVLLRLLIGKDFVEEMWKCVTAFVSAKSEGSSECEVIYLQWLEMVKASLETMLGSGSPWQEFLLNCLDLDPECRPRLSYLWENMRGLNTNRHSSHTKSLNDLCIKADFCKCFVLGELCNTLNSKRHESNMSELDNELNDCELDPSQSRVGSLDKVVEGICAGKVHCQELQGHLDSITGLCVGGGFLFSSSFDKTVNVWSLQHFEHVHTFRGHEHRVMAVVFVDQEKPLCVSGDSGGGIFCWEAVQHFGLVPLKKWYEEKDWRYSGIHAMAVSEIDCIYTGSGDRLIKCWSLTDCTLLCTMEGHKSVVSALTLCNGVLYSGSWDGTVRLWSLHDHSPLAVFGEERPGIVSPILALCADKNLVTAAHEKGDIKIWMNDALKASKQIHTGAVLALCMEEGWLFSGGWGKTMKVQEIRGAGSDLNDRDVGYMICDSVITALTSAQGMLFVGYANRLIKVFHC